MDVLSERAQHREREVEVGTRDQGPAQPDLQPPDPRRDEQEGRRELARDGRRPRHSPVPQPAPVHAVASRSGAASGGRPASPAPGAADDAGVRAAGGPRDQGARARRTQRGGGQREPEAGGPEPQVDPPGVTAPTQGAPVLVHAPSVCSPADRAPHVVAPGPSALRRVGASARWARRRARWWSDFDGGTRRTPLTGRPPGPDGSVHAGALREIEGSSGYHPRLPGRSTPWIPPSPPPPSKASSSSAAARSATSTRWASDLLIVATDRVSAYDVVLSPAASPTRAGS